MGSSTCRVSVPKACKYLSIQNDLTMRLQRYVGTYLFIKNRESTNVTTGFPSPTYSLPFSHISFIHNFLFRWFALPSLDALFSSSKVGEGMDIVGN